ncbi:hypothetical protein [Paludisphaera soli]|uniref:hypothetical protein n=1 Tax=Paludisphaera soli TaxID=2712865 RepID=UPI0013EA33EC|nr:hypothetical protein [Paludisphaera soli]
MHLKRIEGRYYAYESTRQGDRFTSRCWGRMPDRHVPMCLELVRDCREMRAIEKAEAEREQARTLAPLVALRDEVIAYGAEVDAAVASVLTAFGYHRPRRGPWRKQRGRDMGDSAAKAKVEVARTKIGELIHLANKGDALAAEKLPAALVAAAGRSGGDVETETFSLMLDVLPAPKEPAEARVELMKRELAPPGSSLMVRLMAGRVVADWTHVQTWEKFLAGAHSGKFKATVGDAMRWEKSLNAAVLRYQRGLVALARIKRLDLPVIAQVNIAEAGSQQLNQARVDSTLAGDATRQPKDRRRGNSATRSASSPRA